MKKVIFGANIKYTKTDKGYKKKSISYPNWGSITESQPIKKGQTVVMRTGKEFGIMCLDLDTKDPNHPDFKLMAEKIYTVAPTLVQETQNGYHFFYKWNKHLARSSTKITKNKDSKLDIKSDKAIITIKAPVPYYEWWTHTKYQKPAEFTEEAWKILKPRLTKKYLGEKEDKGDLLVKLDKTIEKYEKNPTPQIEKQIERLHHRIENWGKYKPNPNDPKIKRAKEYPIRKLLNEPTANVIRCISPDHEDKNPSMQITGNFAYCHGCGATFDAIEILRLQKPELSFKEAVEELSK